MLPFRSPMLGAFRETIDPTMFSLRGTGGFSAANVTASGSVGSGQIVGNWLEPNTNTEFDAPSGKWTAANSGLHLMAMSGFPENGKGSGERQQRLYLNGVAEDHPYIQRDFTGNGSGSSACISFLREVTSGDEFEIEQLNLDRMQFGYFSAIYFPSTEMDGEFYAKKSPASGSVGGVIAGLTEEFDNDSAFNATTGVYTAANAGLHLFLCHFFPTAASSTQYGCSLLVNGTAEGYKIDVPNPWNNEGTTRVAAVLVDLSASDTVSWRQDGDTADTVGMGGMRITGSSEYFSARKAVASGSAGSTITGWTEDFDVGANFNPTTGVFTAPSSGTWWFCWSGSWSGSGSNENRMDLIVDGNNLTTADKRILNREFLGALNSGEKAYSMVAPIYLRAGQEITLYQFDQIVENCYFAGFKVDW